jgi:hypothetical protein
VGRKASRHFCGRWLFILSQKQVLNYIVRNCMQPHPNELIHSFIFRKYKQHSISQYSSIISQKGKWHQKPSVAKGALWIFKGVGDDVLQQTMIKSGYCEKNEGIFDSPVGHISDLKGLLINKQHYKINAVYKSFSISFCTDCIIDQITDIGFGYIHYKWRRGGFCEKHEKPLQYILDDTVANTTSSLSNILRGVLDSNTGKYNIGRMSNTFENDFKKKDMVYVAPCLKNDFKNWLCSNEHNFSEALANKLQYTSARLKRITTNDYVYIHRNKKLLTLLLESNNQQFKFFWKSQSLLKTFDCGVIERSSLKASIYISKNSDCTKCIHKSCAPNQLIEYYWSKDI